MSDRAGGRFTGMAGMLTAAAAVISAIGALIFTLFQVGVLGGDDQGNASATPPVSAGGPTSVTGSSNATPAGDDWAAQANGICEQANDDVAALLDPKTVDATNIGAIASAGREVADVGRRQLRKLQKLTPPTDDRPKVKRLIRIYAEQNELLEDLNGKLRMDDLAGRDIADLDIARFRSQFARLRSLGTASDELAKQLGATSCAEGSSFSQVPIPGGP